MKNSCPYDPFKKDRQEAGVIVPDFEGERIPMILRYHDVRTAARDPEKFSSDTPFRVPIPSEEGVRRVRQLPIETDPPEHTEWRKIVEPFFRRPSQPDFIEKVDALIRELLEEARGKESVEIVREFALPLQSRALTYLLDVPETEAEIWIRWGTHVFRDSGEGGDGEAKGVGLEAYIQGQLDRALAAPGEDFFSALTRATFQGRALTRDEMVGFANLTFAGGRDTVINTISSIVAYVGENPEALATLRGNPRLMTLASEEFVRVFSPLTHIGRTCPVDTQVQGVPVQAGERVSLCWASANFDETVFESPEEIRLNRQPNPHIGFGAGAHTCLGAAHARLIIRALLRQLCAGVNAVEILEAKKNSPSTADYLRQVGCESLRVKFG